MYFYLGYPVTVILDAAIARAVTGRYGNFFPTHRALMKTKGTVNNSII